jgi:hypothetical protein
MLLPTTTAAPLRADISPPLDAVGYPTGEDVFTRSQQGVGVHREQM